MLARQHGASRTTQGHQLLHSTLAADLQVMLRSGRVSLHGSAAGCLMLSQKDRHVHCAELPLWLCMVSFAGHSGSSSCKGGIDCGLFWVTPASVYTSYKLIFAFLACVGMPMRGAVLLLLLLLLLFPALPGPSEIEAFAGATAADAGCS